MEHRQKRIQRHTQRTLNCWNRHDIDTLISLQLGAVILFAEYIMSATVINRDLVTKCCHAHGMLFDAFFDSTLM